MPLLPPKGPVLQQSSADREAGYMFPSSLLTVDVVGEVPEGLLVRPLHVDDYENGFLECLAQLTKVGEISRDAWSARFSSMKNNQPQSYFVVVVEEASSHRVVGAATLVIEWKFIHQAGCRGRVEDVVIDKEMRGKKLGALLNRILVALAKKTGVYKLSLECKDTLIPFYELYGYKKDVGNNFLVQRFDDDVTIPAADHAERTGEFEPSKI